jgi:DNA-binding transcriptional LysR family regulator
MLGCTLLERTTRSVQLTRAGEVFLTAAIKILDIQNEVWTTLKTPDIEGDISFASPEDFATHYLPQVLSSFRHHYPRVMLNVSCDLTLNLLRRFRQQEFDMILIKQDPKISRYGTKVWREPLVWAGHSSTVEADYKSSDILSLVVSPEPCIYRARALAALKKAKRKWRISYTSPSLAGTIAAVKAGLGITILPANMLPTGVQALKSLPDLADAEIALLKHKGLSKAAKLFADHIVSSLERKTL